MAKLMLSTFAGLQEWFIDQLRSKVNRGQNNAFYVGGNLGNPAIGYKVRHRQMSSAVAKIQCLQAITISIEVS